MTDYQKETERRKTVIKEAIKELEQSPANRALSDATDMMTVMKSLNARFELLRTDLGVWTDLIKHYNSDALKYTILSKALAQGDYSVLLEKEGIDATTVQVEDGGMFARLMEKLANTRQYDTRMASCVKINKMIKTAIDSWTSKHNKLCMLSQVTGSTAAEVESSEKKIIQIKEAIKTLKKRGEQVTSVYFSTKRALSSWIKEMEESFEVINNNEEV